MMTLVWVNDIYQTFWYSCYIYFIMQKVHQSSSFSLLDFYW
jgi:hypothetical protein